jgi:ComF family protein
MAFPVNQNLLKKVDGFRKALVWSLLPARCLLCDQPGMRNMDVCETCWKELPLNRLCCPVCALPLAAPAVACGICLRRTPEFHRTVAPMQYHAPISVLMSRFKFHQDLAAGRLLTELFCRHTKDVELPDVLVPVPLHGKRLRQRGFDQALELAKGIATRKSLRLRSDVLSRIRYTEAQTDLNAVERRKNCKGAFVLNTHVLPPHIALVDDVMTTGTTVGECAKVLRNAGVKRVDVWVMARVATP